MRVTFQDVDLTPGGQPVRVRVVSNEEFALAGAALAYVDSKVHGLFPLSDDLLLRFLGITSGSQAGGARHIQDSSGQYLRRPPHAPSRCQLGHEQRRAGARRVV